MNDQQWAKRVSGDFQAALNRKADANAALQAQEQIRTNYTGILFSELQTAFNAKATALNAEMRRELISFESQPGSTTFTVRRNEPSAWVRKIMIQTDALRHGFNISIYGQTPGELRALDVEVDKEMGKGYLAEKGKSVTPDEVAESTLESLLKLGL